MKARPKRKTKLENILISNKHTIFFIYKLIMFGINSVSLCLYFNARSCTNKYFYLNRRTKIRNKLGAVLFEKFDYFQSFTSFATMRDYIKGTVKNDSIQDHDNSQIYNGRTKRVQMAQIIDGKQIASEIRNELKAKIDKWVQEGHRPPQLTAVLIGSDPASCTYVKNKMKAAVQVGIESITKNLSPEITEEELLQLIDDLNNDDSVDGILVQLPVPSHINERRICNSISCDKDVDGFNEKNVGKLCLDMNTLIPCTPLGVQELLRRAGIDTFGKNAVVVGRSKNVGMPIAMLLHADGRNDTCAMDATVTICHRFTPPDELKAFCKLADIIVTATGVPGLIKADMVKPGACIIDVGLTRIVNEATGKAKLVGDVDFEGVRQVAGHITPVPGGVGPMTVTMLMKNTYIASRNLARKRLERK